MDYELALYQQFYGDPPADPPEYDDFAMGSGFDAPPARMEGPPQPELPHPVPPTAPENPGPHGECCLCLPYPPARACKPCERTARIISSAYAGCLSELSAAMQYFYQSLFFAPCYPEAAKTLGCISRCEMRHIRLLGELLVSLGCPPKYRATTPQNASGWWNASPSFVHYDTRLESALLDNLSGEMKAIEFYRRAIQQIDDDGVCLLLRRIILDEEHHIELFKAIYERCLR
ncbi:MAG: ferritin-like domain-containing protein [Oscillospiraceae bacterium]